MSRELVRLVHGPLHGKFRHVPFGARIHTFFLDADEVEASKRWRATPNVKRVIRPNTATYQRQDDRTWRWVRDQTAIGDTDLRFYDEVEKKDE